MINLGYWNGVVNAGDLCSEYLLTSYGYPYVINNKSPNLYMIGSIIGMCKKAIICGAGYSNPDETNKLLQPKDFYLVRGELSKQKCGNSNIPIGDPGLLVSKFLDGRNKQKTHTIGVIPHYVDWQFVTSKPLPKTYKVIDIRTNNFTRLFNEILSCDYVLSSSLHGMIFAHSFGIPAMQFKYNELYSKNDFKFKDYYSVYEDKLADICKVIEKHDDLSDPNILYIFKHASDQFAPTKDVINKIQNDIDAAVKSAIKTIG